MAAVARQADEIITSGGGVSILRAGIVTAKAGVFVVGGYGAAELGSALLRAGIGPVEEFAGKGKVQAAIVKAAPGLVATIIMSLLTFKGASARGRSRPEAAGAAAKVAVLMLIGIGASVLREPIGELTTSLRDRVASMLGGASSSPVPKLTTQQARAAGDNLRSLEEHRSRRAGAETVGDGGMHFGDEGAPFGGSSETIRAGGDSGFTSAKGVNTARIMQTESW